MGVCVCIINQVAYLKVIPGTSMFGVFLVGWWLLLGFLIFFKPNPKKVQFHLKNRLQIAKHG